jgi:FAD/FMN-containing dehydrogenase
MATDLSTKLRKIQSQLDPALLVVEDPASNPRYSRDWSGDYVGCPAMVLRPRTSEEVSEIIRTCMRLGVSVVPQGGHTGLVGAATPSADGCEVVLSLERMNRIRDIDPLNYSMVVEAGCILEAVHQAAIEKDRFFPLSLGAQGSCQIGGNVATNAGGLNVLRYGMMRDLVLGVEVVLADGQIWNGLKCLRKNNMGYDLRHLFVGSEGTLGIVTAAALKLFPRPTKTITAFLAVRSVFDAMQLYSLARTEMSDLLSGFELIPRSGVELAIGLRDDLRDPLEYSSPFYILLEATASGRVELSAMGDAFLESMIESGLVADGALASSEGQAKSFWGIREAMVEAQVRYGRHLRTDVSVPISSLSLFVTETEKRLFKEASDAVLLCYGHIGDGNIHYNVLPPRRLHGSEVDRFLKRCEEIIFEMVDRLDGSISAEHGIGISKKAAYLDRVQPHHLARLNAIKSAFDPLHLLSPGRLLP